jgi:3-phenylpropionate/trans-cinnamate dioxygenase ferredoxin component
MSDWIRVCATGELLPGESIVAWDGGTPILVLNYDGDFHALEDRCSHEDFELSAGNFDGDEATIECVLHGGRQQFGLFAALDPQAQAVARQQYLLALDAGEGRIGIVTFDLGDRQPPGPVVRRPRRAACDAAGVRARATGRDRAGPSGAVSPALAAVLVGRNHRGHHWRLRHHLRSAPVGSAASLSPQRTGPGTGPATMSSATHIPVRPGDCFHAQGIPAPPAPSRAGIPPARVLRAGTACDQRCAGLAGLAPPACGPTLMRSRLRSTVFRPMPVTSASCSGLLNGPLASR